MNDILFEEYDLYHLTVGVVTLNRPEKLNVLTMDMICLLDKHLRRWQADASIAFVIIKATACKAFCAGADVCQLYDAYQRDKQPNDAIFQHEYRLNYLISGYQKPYIALMDGITMGGGVGVSLHGRYRIATEQFCFAMPETTIGLFPDVGSRYFLSRLKGQVGVYLGLTGARVGPADCYELGLVDYTVPTDALADVFEQLIALKPQDNLDNALAALFSQFAAPFDGAVLAKDQNWIATCFASLSVAENVQALQAQGSERCARVAQELLEKSPISLAVSREALVRAQQCTLAECLQTDYQLVRRFIRGHDFYEGVRALLIDKDKTPRWQPSLLQDLTQADVEDYFALLFGDPLSL